MLKKEKRKTQDTLHLSASSKKISATESSYDLKNMETEQMVPVILETKSNSHSKSQGQSRDLFSNIELLHNHL